MVIWSLNDSSYSGDQYALKMRFLDHVFDEMVVDEMLLKIILPEGVKDVRLRCVSDPTLNMIDHYYNDNKNEKPLHTAVTN